MDEHATDRSRPLQFSLMSLLLAMAAVGFACALAPRQFGPMQIYCIVYVLIGQGQVYYLVRSWQPRLRHERPWTPTSRDAAPYIQLAGWLSLPTWLWLVVTLGLAKWYGVSTLSVELLAAYALLPLLAQTIGLLVNLRILVHYYGPLDVTLRRLALLNLAHVIAFAFGCWYFLPDIIQWR